MKIKEITCKTALSPSKLPGLDYALNPYLGCDHQCAYCYVPTVLHMNQDQWKECISVKRNIPLKLAKELSKKRRGVVGISTVTDAYQTIEKKYRITRYCLEQLQKFDFPIQIQTKSDLVLRDIDLIKRFSQAEIMMSIGTFNDKYRSILEPNACSIEKRIKVLDELKESKSIKTSVFLGPLYPDISLNDMIELLDQFIELDLSTILIDNLHLKPGLKEQIRLILHDDESLKSAFEEHIFKSSNWFQNISKEIKKYVKHHSTKIIVKDAF